MQVYVTTRVILLEPYEGKEFRSQVYFQNCVHGIAAAIAWDKDHEVDIYILDGDDDTNGTQVARYSVKDGMERLLL